MSKQKSELLGENFSTATSKLRKSILFDLVKKLELDDCHRCTLKISDINDFSIEHKESWQRADDPIESFYSLENIAFSHLKCNVGAAIKIHKIYENKQGRKAAQWSRYYDKKKDDVLCKKRERYHLNK